MATQPPFQLHPIAAEAAGYLAEEGAKLVFVPGGLERLTDSLKKLLDSPDLLWAARSLAGLVAHLEVDLKQVEPARALLRVAELAVPALDRLARDRKADAAVNVQDLADQARGEYSKLIEGAAQKRTAAKVGEKAPEGSVKSASLFVPRKMR